MQYHVCLLCVSISASPKNADKLSIGMNLSLATASSSIISPNKMQIGTAVTSSSSTKFDSAHQVPRRLEMNKVGQSVFYDCLDLSPMAEKQDDMKPERSDTEEDSKHSIACCLSAHSTCNFH